VKRPSTIYKT